MSVTREQIEGLRALANWLEANPGLNVHIAAVANVTTTDRAELANAVLRMGGGEKFTDTYRIGVRRTFAENVTVNALAYHATVCEKVVTTETVQEPDPEALARVPLVTREVERVEWKCPDSLLALR